MPDDAADRSAGGIQGEGQPCVGALRIELVQPILPAADAGDPEPGELSIFMDEVDSRGLGVLSPAGEAIGVFGVNEASQQLTLEADLVDQGSERLYDIDRARASRCAGVKGETADCARCEPGVVEKRDGDLAACGDSQLVELDNPAAVGIGYEQGVIQGVPGDAGGELEGQEGGGDGVEQLREVGAVLVDPFVEKGRDPEAVLRLVVGDVLRGDDREGDEVGDEVAGFSLEGSLPSAPRSASIASVSRKIPVDI